MKKKMCMFLIAGMALMMTGCGGADKNVSENASSVEATSEAEAAAEKEEASYQGSNAYKGMDISVVVKENGEAEITFSNDTSNGFSIGWVDGGQADLTANGNKYYAELELYKIKAGQEKTYDVSFDNLTDAPESIKIEGINQLSTDGLPVSQNPASVEITLSNGTEGKAVSANSQEKTEAVAHISGKASKDGIKLSLDQEEKSDISLTVANESSKTFQFGWVNSAQAHLTTTEGDYYYPLEDMSMVQQMPGEEETIDLYFDNVSGEYVSLDLENIVFLSDQGLPEDVANVGTTIHMEFERTSSEQ